MDLWYAHEGTTVYMLTRLPEGTQRKAGYDESGWTTYERRSAEQIKKFHLWNAAWTLVLDLGASRGTSGGNWTPKERSRNWPLDPDGFDALIESKQFTNGADKGAVKALYRKMSEGQLGSVRKLDFLFMQKPTVRDMEQCGRCLSLCRRLQVCSFFEVGLTDETCAALFSTLATDAHIEVLYLGGNQLGPAAAKEIAAYLCGNHSLEIVRAACLLFAVHARERVPTACTALPPEKQPGRRGRQSPCAGDLGQHVVEGGACRLLVARSACL
eukprot:6735310-Prymnesium_polylepis.1